MIATAFLSALFAPPRVVYAQTHYTFTKIADSNQITNLGSTVCVAIGNSGTVIFVFVANGNATLWRGNGTSTPTQVEPTLEGAAPCAASINDQDEIAYIINTFPTFPYSRLIRNSNGTKTEIVTSGQSPYFNPDSRSPVPSLANNGSAVFIGGPSAACGGSGGGDTGIYIGPSGTIVYDPLCDSGADITPNSPIAGTMNDNLVVTFNAQSKSGKNGIYRGSLTPLVQDGSNGITLINSPQRPVINNSGTVAFLGMLNGGPASIYTTSDGVSFTRAGQYSPSNFLAINDSGKVAYAATDVGIYAGPDSVADKVIAPGDPLDGSVFQYGLTYWEGINNDGQIAFFARLQDCETCPIKYGVYRANPNHPPRAFDGTASVPSGGSVNGTLVATDPDGDALTYSIVDNGKKGTAVITDTASGAYTYTANAGSSGTDTFTFKANDSFDNSNVATITVTITTPSPCAADISATVAVTSQGPLKFNKKTGRYTQTLTLKNGDGAASGPVSLVLDSLSNATLFGADGTTACTTPTGSPYVNVNVGADVLFSPRERATVTLEFVSPSGQATYTTRVLAGTNSR